tara:strand:- start:2163 stop:2801 length:639 start_codon:yes stop_codon:yes gene_type:complete
MNPLDLLVDVRSGTEPKEKYLKYKNKIARIDTLCLHQMACKDSDNQGWKRWKKLAAHWVITEGENAKAYWLHDFSRRLPTSHGYNRRSIGFEIEGYFAGVGVDPKTFWKPKSSKRVPMVPTRRQLDAAIAACEASIYYVNTNGGEIKFISAHRQSYGTKRSDPGSLLWEGIAVPLFRKYKNLQIAPVLDTGKQIPEAWDSTASRPETVGVKY